MHDELDEDYESEHDQYLDSGDELEAMFGDELEDDEAEQPAAEDEDADLDDEYQGGLDEDY